MGWTVSRMAQLQICWCSKPLKNPHCNHGRRGSDHFCASWSTTGWGLGQCTPSDERPTARHTPSPRGNSSGMEGQFHFHFHWCFLQRGSNCKYIAYTVPAHINRCLETWHIVHLKNLSSVNSPTTRLSFELLDSCIVGLTSSVVLTSHPNLQVCLHFMYQSYIRNIQTISTHYLRDTLVSKKCF